MDSFNIEALALRLGVIMVGASSLTLLDDIAPHLMRALIIVGTVAMFMSAAAF